MFESSLVDRFWSKVDIKGPDDCWNWKNYTWSSGYGLFYISEKRYRSHRIAWKLSNGDIPESLCCLHKCDNRLCCNPNHLYLGTRLDNAKDRQDRYWNSERRYKGVGLDNNLP